MLSVGMSSARDSALYLKFNGGRSRMYRKSIGGPSHTSASVHLAPRLASQPLSF